MKFIVDAHLPVILADWLRKKGHDTTHTRFLPNQNRTEDIDIIKLSVQEKRIVISKDSDFLKYFLLNRQPYKLIMITTGNIVNEDFMVLFKKNFQQLLEYLETNYVVELENTSVIAHL